MRKVMLCVAALALGCSEPFAPRDVAGIYVLVSVDGKAPPMRYEESATISVLVLTDSVILNADGTGRSTRLYQETDSQEGTSTMRASNVGFAYRVDGRTVRSTAQVCPMGELCAAAAKKERWTIVGDRLFAGRTVLQRR